MKSYNRLYSSAHGASLTWMLLVLACLATFPGRALALVQWDETSAEVTAKVTDGEVTCVFGFVNVGAQQVAIQRIQLSSPAVKASADAETYAPGAKGRIAVTVAVNDRVGVLRDTVTVRMTAGHVASATQLTVRVSVPPRVQMAPSPLVWTQGGPNTAKTMRIVVLEKEPVVFDAVHSTDEHFRVELKTVVVGREYQLVAQPRDTLEPVSATLRLELKGPDGRPRFLETDAVVAKARGPSSRPK